MESERTNWESEKHSLIEKCQNQELVIKHVKVESDGFESERTEWQELVIMLRQSLQEHGVAAERARQTKIADDSGIQSEREEWLVLKKKLQNDLRDKLTELDDTKRAHLKEITSWDNERKDWKDLLAKLKEQVTARELVITQQASDDAKREWQRKQWNDSTEKETLRDTIKQLEQEAGEHRRQRSLWDIEKAEYRNLKMEMMVSWKETQLAKEEIDIKYQEAKAAWEQERREWTDLLTELKTMAPKDWPNAIKYLYQGPKIAAAVNAAVAVGKASSDAIPDSTGTTNAPADSGGPGADSTMAASTSSFDDFDVNADGVIDKAEWEEQRKAVAEWEAVNQPQSQSQGQGQGQGRFIYKLRA